MKKLIVLAFFVIVSAPSFSQSRYESESDSIVSLLPEMLGTIAYTIQGNERYKLYPTENIYNLLKLDTSNGRIWQLQWSLDRDKEGIMQLNPDALTYDSHIGKFELYPTQNMYQFILLDKETGQTWHVQWGETDSKRWIRKIY